MILPKYKIASPWTRSIELGRFERKMGKSGTASGKIWFGTVTMVIAAFFYCAMNISIKLMATHLTVWQTAIGRFALGAFLVPIIAGPMRLELFGRSRGLHIVRGASGTCSFLLLIQAFRMIPLSEGMVIFYLWPVFACLLSPWIADERITKREWPFVGGALIGTVIIIWPESALLGLNPGHLLALGGAFLSGLAIILTRRLGRNNNPFTLYFYLCMTGGMICIGPLLAQAPPLFPASGIGWAGLMTIAVFALFAQVLLNQGMKVLNASRTGVIMMIDPLFATAFGAVSLGEPMGLKLLVGSALILGCGLVLAFLPASFNYME